MTLEEYRIKVIERLRACQDSACARSLIDEVEMMLHNSPISSRTHEAFWEDLMADLDALGEEVKFLTNREASRALDVVVSAARACAGSYRAQLLQGGRQSAN